MLIGSVVKCEVQIEFQEDPSEGDDVKTSSILRVLMWKSHIKPKTCTKSKIVGLYKRALNLPPSLRRGDPQDDQGNECLRDPKRRHQSTSVKET